MCYLLTAIAILSLLSFSFFFYTCLFFISFFFFFFNDPPPTEIYPLPLHAALPIGRGRRAGLRPPRPRRPGQPPAARRSFRGRRAGACVRSRAFPSAGRWARRPGRAAGIRRQIGRAHV